MFLMFRLMHRMLLRGLLMALLTSEKFPKIDNIIVSQTVNTQQPVKISIYICF